VPVFVSRRSVLFLTDFLPFLLEREHFVEFAICFARFIGKWAGYDNVKASKRCWLSTQTKPIRSWVLMRSLGGVNSTSSRRVMFASQPRHDSDGTQPITDNYPTRIRDTRLPRSNPRMIVSGHSGNTAPSVETTSGEEAGGISHPTNVSVRPFFIVVLVTLSCAALASI
jgi:hypothetical protein